MVSVAQAVSDIIERKPFLEESLVDGIINYAYLADMIKPEVEQATGKKVNRYAVVMAIRRLSEVLQESFVNGSVDMLKGSDVTITSGIFEITVRKDQNSLKNSPKLYEMVDFSKGDFLTITHGMYEMAIISNMKYKDKMIDIFGKREIINTRTGLSSLIVRIPAEAVDSVGVLYTLTKALSWENINIVEVVSTLTEEIFIIDEKSASMAFNAVNRMIRNRK